MSMYYRKHGKPYEPEYERPGRTKQSFVDECDINQIMKRAQIAGGLSHLQKYGAEYQDFAEAPTDLLEAHEHLKRGEAIFSELPPEIRREFRQNPFEFFKYVNDPANSERLNELIPAIAEPGRYFPDVANQRVTPNVPETPQNTPEEPSEAPET